jgi:tetratricopeptide (TPR) repeat protein
MAGSREQPARASGRTDGPDGSRWGAALTVVALAAVATFARGLSGGLLESWDDDRFVLNFDAIRAINFENLAAIWSEAHFQAWHPLHLMSYWLDVPWAGPDPLVIHVVSLGMWVLTLVAVLHVMRALGLPLVAATLATLAYGLHPVQIEAVTWATGRKEILAAAFTSLAILAHLRSERWTDAPAWLSRVMYLAGALSKTTVLPLPGVLLLIDLLLRGVSWKRAVGRQLPMLAVGVGLAAVVVWVWDTNAMIRPDAAGNTVGGRVMLVMATLSHHLRMAVLPIDNAAVYPVHRTNDFSPMVVIGPLVFVGALALAWVWRSKRALFSLGAFFVLLLPVLNLIPMYWHWMDRYLSLPLLPLCFGFGAAVERLDRAVPKRVIPVVAALAVAALAGRTVQHQVVYTSDKRLWRHATREHPESFYAWVKWGEHLRDAGKLDQAIEAYRTAVELEPGLRLGAGALFYTIALRDERDHDLSPSKAKEFTRRYHAYTDQPAKLRDLASDMIRAGYRDAALFALSRAHSIKPMRDERLERNALHQMRSGRRWLARFFVSRMKRPPFNPALQKMWRAMRKSDKGS